ncbi:GlsB/YeaQ/YmgE family stress response membrane protein [Aestuariimicrobium ganziense]|uniref:GlsB/YeaQ/YmgE family stress response membrane protein n=1 Tax=Aestuariimicrobium ganziense TaxID=2773677 RepID=UPI001945536A|nr:GlsB/YeaQ/YmgE family stress response membrane protein [Aestuariimicrobium ganziense]
MGILGWLVLGLIAGAIAKAIMPGNQGGGWIVTIILGIIGAVLGGFLGSLLFDVGLGTFWDIKTWVLAIVGALLVLFIWGLVTKNRRV